MDGATTATAPAIGQATSGPQATQDAEPTRQGIWGRVGSQPTAGPEATQDAEPTRQGIWGRVGSQPTAGPEATEGADDAAPRLADSGDPGTAKVEFASVSAGGIHTCGVMRDSTVACWGDDSAGQATPPAGEFASVSAGWEHTAG